MKTKRKNTRFELKWKILKKFKSIRNDENFCRLCTTEAEMIIKNQKGPINMHQKRNNE